MRLHLRYSASTHRGYDRDNNEDSVFAGPRLLALADGMGGHAAGEVASSLVIAELAGLDELKGPFDPLVELGQAAARANEAIARYGAEHPETEGMGTTLTAVLFSDDRVALFHIGDSRAYLLRDGSLTQLTRDDTLVQQLVDAGRLTPDEARSHPRRSVVTQVLRGEPVEPALGILGLRANDRLLICSDGVSDAVSPAELVEALRIDDPQRCAFPILQLAMRAGSRDNVTCIVAHIGEHDLGYNVPIIGGAADRLAASR
ncbi:MAG: family protein phosphatase [Actinomycetota bacterium]|jgi:protein phosphatase|nr:family protein phosphatase [Actinomycetota bacterium]